MGHKGKSVRRDQSVRKDQQERKGRRVRPERPGNKGQPGPRDLRDRIGRGHGMRPRITSPMTLSATRVHHGAPLGTTRMLRRSKEPIGRLSLKKEIPGRKETAA